MWYDKNMTKLQKAYLAGLFDGEGYVGIVRRKTKTRKPYYHNLQVEVANTHKPTIDRVNKLFPGCVYSYKPTKLTRKLCWDWRVSSHNAVRFLKTILPYLRIKRVQAVLGIQFQKEKSQAHRNGGLTPKTLRRRDNMMKQMQQLKKYGAHAGEAI